MHFFDVSWFGIAAWRVCAVTSLLLVACLIYILNSRKRQETPKKLRAWPPAGEIVYTNAPTVRLTDMQPIDRLHRVVNLKAGEHIDLKELTFGRVPQLRVGLNSIDRESGECFANIQLDLGGAVARCGAAVKEVKENSFLVPRASDDEQRCSILYFLGKSDAVSFLQVKVQKLDRAEQSAAIDVLHIRGRWTA